MSNNSLGGFFIDLGVNVNKDAFSQARSSLDGIGDGVVRLLGTVRNAVPLIADTLGALGEIGAGEGGLLTTATYLGLNTEALEKWRVAARIAGADANGLTSEMSKLQGVFNAINKGQVDTGLAENLSHLGINYMELEAMDSDKRLQRVLEAAQGMKDQSYASDLVASVYGQNAAQILQTANALGMSISDILGKASGVVFTTDDSKLKGLGFNTELQTTMAALEQLRNLFGTEIADKITPFLKNFNDWLTKNGPGLVEKILNIVDSLGQFGGSLKTVWDAATAYMNGDKEQAQELIEQASDKATESGAKLVSAIVPGAPSAEEIVDYNKNQKEAAKIIADWKTKHGIKGQDFAKPIDWTHLDPNTKNSIKNLVPIDKFPSWYTGIFSNDLKWINDGIISPNGNVTQVAPDDWVFAARDVGALARAFLPQNTGTGSASFVINQTFNVSGSNDIPDTLRNQAYRGAEDGLHQALQNNQIRMQLMPALV